MKMRAFLMLGLALVLAGASVFLARNWILTRVEPQSVQEPIVPQVQLAKVVVAATPLFFGNNIRREHLREVDWPADVVPPGAFNSIDEILSDDSTEGAEGDGSVERVALRKIEINEPVLKSKVSGFGGRATLSSILAPEMRASTISVNGVSGVAGFVLPGDHVDVMLTRTGEGGEGALLTDVLLQNIKVLAIAQDANEDRSKPGVVSVVTFELTPVQSQKLVLAMRLGALSLALRHVTNAAAEIPKTVTLRDLKVGEANQPPGEVKAPPKKTVIVKKTPKKKKEGLSVRIVRGLSSSKYEVQPERQPLFSTPADSKPLELVPPTTSTTTTQPASSSIAKAVSAPLSLLQPADQNSTEVEAVAE
jgi:pilus assembly protein CpaB